MKKLIPFVLGVLLFVACKKESEQLSVIPISDYAPLTVGKYITYSLDSLVFVNFGTVEAHRFYEIKYVVADSIRDLLGRKGFRIVRYIRMLPNGTFTPDNTSIAVNTVNTYEFTENNLRYFKLTQPLANERSWKGNSAIDAVDDPITGIDLSYLADWDYTYSEVGKNKKIGNFDLPNTLTVNQINDSFNLPIRLPNVRDCTLVATKNYSQEIYCKGIGLVKKDFLNYEYQISSAYKGYGVKLVMIDHN
ncbi:MAG: hypothetical protein ACKVOM_04490 [Ferruginibacter sp.]